ncbi:hypothetical protein LINPERPRIM_LOCUS30771 [Linum perenne]
MSGAVGCHTPTLEI